MKGMSLLFLKCEVEALHPLKEASKLLKENII